MKKKRLGDRRSEIGDRRKKWEKMAERARGGGLRPYRRAGGRLRREPLERMVRIHELLAAGRHPNAATIAKEMEVSQKTLHRDMEYMKIHFKLPIEYDRLRHGYFYSEKV